MDVVLRHQFDELVESQLILLGPSQPHYQFGLVVVDVVAVLPDDLLQLLDRYLPLVRVFIEILFEVFPVSVVLDESVLELVQLVHVDVLPLELHCHVPRLLVEVSRVIQPSNRSLQPPLHLLPLPPIDTVHPQGLKLGVRPFEGLRCLGRLLVVGRVGEGLGCFVVAALGLDVAGLKDVLGVEGDTLLISVGVAHVVHPLSPQLHS